MHNVLRFLNVFLLLGGLSTFASAQQFNMPLADTVRRDSVQNIRPPSTYGQQLSIFNASAQSIHALKTTVNGSGKSVNNFADSLIGLKKMRNALNGTFGKLDSGKLKKVKSSAKTRVSAAANAYKAKVNTLKNSAVKLDVAFEDAERYQPSFGFIGANATSKFVNVFSVRGALTAFGIPVNIDLSTDRASYGGPAVSGNDLFKFDLAPGSLKELFKSDLQQYIDVRRNLFAGADLSAYTRSQLTERLGIQPAKIQNILNGQPYSGYLNSSAAMQELLGMDKQSIISKLEKESGYKITGYVPLAARWGNLAVGEKTMAVEKIKLKKDVLQQISGNGELNTYFNVPGNIEQIRLLGKEHIRNKITAALATHNTQQELPSNAVYVDTVENKPSDEVIEQLSQNIFLSSRQYGRIGFNQEIKREQQIADNSLDSLSRVSFHADSTTISSARGDSSSAALHDHIEQIAESVSAVKQDLQQKGIDVNKMLAMQQYLEDGSGQPVITEFTSQIRKGQPVNRLQSLFTKVNALKLGAYSNKVPGGVQSDEVFLKGGHITLKSGFMPLTFGYGSITDISSLKDGGYQGSVYNQPRNVTYIGAEVKRAGMGNLKLSMVSSVNREVRNSLYSIPTISTNNVAFTLSKGLNIGRLGQVDLDVSKSTTLYDNKFQPGTEAILNTKGGLNYNLSNELFQALSVGFSHHLELQTIHTSDNIYFNYSGMGYQNPANNGFGGARMKMGGNLKKSFYGNKLMLTVRSDLSNMPISYTSDDRWKTYLFQLDSRYLVSKKVSLNLKYTSNGTDRRVDGVNNQVYSFEKIQVDGNASYKIGKNYTVSHFGVGTQAIKTAAPAGSVATDSRLLLVNYVQTMVMKQNVMTFTLFYNRELTPVKLIGNMLNSDLSYQYKLFSKLSLSSGVIYLENSGIIRQAGIRQSIQLLTTGSFDVASLIDIRKDMIKPLYAGLYPSYRAELSLRYHLKAF